MLLMGLDIQRRYHLKMLTPALLTGIYDSQMQYVEYISHCRRMLLGILLKQHLKLQREKKKIEHQAKLRVKTAAGFAALNDAGEHHLNLQKKKQQKTLHFPRSKFAQVRNGSVIRSLDLICMLLWVIMRSRGLSNKKEMNVIAADVFDLHIRGRASAAFTLSCLLKNRNMFYEIVNRWGGGQAVEHVLQKCLAEGRWCIIISISPECWRSVTLIGDRDANKISRRKGEKKQQQHIPCKKTWTC